MLLKKKFEIFMAVVILVAAVLFAKGGAILVDNLNVKKASNCIVIDAGHGGYN
jgi:N-acetylmuramoyl-L-alanine amidase